jgi:hypothetical protein
LLQQTLGDGQIVVRVGRGDELTPLHATQTEILAQPPHPITPNLMPLRGKLTFNARYPVCLARLAMHCGDQDF